MTDLEKWCQLKATCSECRHMNLDGDEAPCNSCFGTAAKFSKEFYTRSFNYEPVIEVKLDGSDPYLEDILSIAMKQRNNGMQTYGQGLEKNPADIITRIEYLQEELCDALMYCSWIKDYLKRKEDDIK